MSYMHVLEQFLKVLECRASTICLLTAQDSLMVKVTRPTPRKLVAAMKELRRAAERQAYFNVDYWGESVRRTSRSDVLRDLDRNIDAAEYDDRIIAAQMHVQESLRDVPASAGVFYVS